MATKRHPPALRPLPSPAGSDLGGGGGVWRALQADSRRHARLALAAARHGRGGPAPGLAATRHACQRARRVRERGGRLRVLAADGADRERHVRAPAQPSHTRARHAPMFAAPRAARLTVCACRAPCAQAGLRAARHGPAHAHPGAVRPVAAAARRRDNLLQAGRGCACQHRVPPAAAAALAAAGGLGRRGGRARAWRGRHAAPLPRRLPAAAAVPEQRRVECDQVLAAGADRSHLRVARAAAHAATDARGRRRSRAGRRALDSRRHAVRCDAPLAVATGGRGLLRLHHRRLHLARGRLAGRRRRQGGRRCVERQPLLAAARRRGAAADAAGVARAPAGGRRGRRHLGRRARAALVGRTVHAGWARDDAGQRRHRTRHRDCAANLAAARRQPAPPLGRAEQGLGI